MGESARAGRQRVVIVDDDEAFVDIVRELLESEGYEVLATADWRDSYLLVKETLPAVVLLDLVMEQREVGWAVLEVLKSDALTQDIPVIVCSAAVSSLDDRRPLLAQYGAQAL